MTDLGTYIQHTDRPAVRFERDYAVSVERLWRAVTDPAEMAAWFPSAVHYDAGVGSAVRFSGDPYAEDGSGRVLVWDPPRAFAFTWGLDELYLELSPTENGSRLVLVNVLEAEDSAARNASGWYVCLVELRKALTGEKSGGPHGADTLAFEPLYEAHRQAGLPSGAEIPTPA